MSDREISSFVLPGEQAEDARMRHQAAVNAGWLDTQPKDEPKATPREEALSDALSGLETLADAKEREQKKQAQAEQAIHRTAAFHQAIELTEQGYERQEVAESLLDDPELHAAFVASWALEDHEYEESPETAEDYLYSSNSGRPSSRRPRKPRRPTS